MSFDDCQLAARRPRAGARAGERVAVRRTASDRGVQRRDARLPAHELRRDAADDVRRDSVDQPRRAAAPPPAPEAARGTSPWDEQETPAFGGETRAIPED